MKRTGASRHEQMVNTSLSDPALSFETFVVPHIDALHRVAFSLCRDTHDADDLVQDSLLRAYRSLGSFDGRHPVAWLLTIMRNANINRHRRRRPGLLPDADDVPAAIDRHNPPAPSAEDEATSFVPPDWIADALAGLSPPHRQVLRLVDIVGLTTDEAAVALGIPVGTVMSRLHRARCRVRSHVGTRAGLPVSDGLRRCG